MVKLLRDLIDAVRSVRAARRQVPVVAIETLVDPHDYDPLELAECMYFVHCIGEAMGHPAGHFVLCQPPARVEG